HRGLRGGVTRALGKSPDERYQSGAGLLRDLMTYKAVGTTPDTTTVLSAAAGAAASALNANASDKTVVFDSGAMSKMGSGSQPAAAAAKPAAAPLQAIDQTVEVGRKKASAGAGKKDPKTLMMVGAGVLALLLVIGGI